MTIDAEWVRENLAPPDAAMAARVRAPASDRALRRELIDFDSEAPEAARFRADVRGTSPESTGMSRFVDVPWPAGLVPTPGAAPEGESLPSADVLIVTWTMDEGHALSRVLTPGFDSRNDWMPYTKNFSAISADMVADCPARNAERLGTYWTTTIGTKNVTLFKSDSHMSQDGAKLPNATVWRQIIADCAPRWVITTGTGGGIGSSLEVGDVVVSRFVEFCCRREFKRLDGEAFACAQPAPGTAQAAPLFQSNAKFLPVTNARAPMIIAPASATGGVLTTDFFGFDDTADTFKLQGLGGLSEMGDAVLGMVCAELGASAPAYTIVRNVSDPQMDSSAYTDVSHEKTIAADIYKRYGRWSSVCSAIVCWSIVAGLP